MKWSAFAVSLGFCLLVTFASSRASIEQPACSSTGWCVENPLASGKINAFHAFAADDLFAVGDNSTLLHFNGTAWARLVAPVAAEFTSVWGSNSTDVYATGFKMLNEETGLYEYYLVHFNGLKWSVTLKSTQQMYSWVWGSSANDVYLGGYFSDNSSLLHFDGAKWSQVLIEGWSSTSVSRVWGISPDDVYLVTYGGAIWHFDGQHWKLTSPIGGYFTGDFQGIWGSAGHGVYHARSRYPNSKIYRLDGSTWLETHSLAENLRVAWGTAWNDAYAVGLVYANPNKIRVLHFDGHEWSVVQELPDFIPQSLGGAGGELYLGGQGTFAWNSSVLYRYDGEAWQLLDAGFGPMRRVWGFSKSDVLAFDNAGTVFHFDGQSWSSKRTGLSAEFNDVWGTSVSDLYVVGAAGLISRYDGDSWTTMASGTSKYLASVWGASANDIYAVGGNEILHFDGAAWGKRAFSGQRGSFTKVTGSSATNIYAVGFGIAYRNGGSGWQWADLSFPNFTSEDVGLYSIDSIAVVSDNEVLALGTECGSVSFDADYGSYFCTSFHQVALRCDGTSWSSTNLGRIGCSDAECNTELKPVPIGDMWGASGKDVFVVGDNGSRAGVWRHNGSTFSFLGNVFPQGYAADEHELVSVWGTAEDDVYAASRGGLILHYQGPPVGAPSSVTASDGTFLDKISVGWTAVPGATGYRILRSNRWDRDFVEIGETTAAVRSLNDAVACGQERYYRVMAFNAEKESLHYTVDRGTTKTCPPEVDPPEGSLVINGGANTTKSASVTLGLTASDASPPIQMCVSNTESCTAWTTFAATKSWTLPGGSGDKRVNVWFRDKWGNKNLDPVFDTIQLDITKPADGAIAIVPGAAPTTFELSWAGFNDAHSGLKDYTLVAATSGYPACSAAPLYRGTGTAFTHSGLALGRTYYYRVCAEDNAKNLSAGATATKKVLPEYDPPTGGSVVIHGKTGDTCTGTTAVTLELNANDPSGPLQMCISNTASCTAWTTFATTKNWTLPGGSGDKRVNVWFRDKWGNKNQDPVFDTIRLDTTKPADGAIAIVPGAVPTTFELSWAGFNDAHSGLKDYTLVAATSGYPACSAAPLYRGTGTTYTHSGLALGRTYYYRVCAEDNAKNLSAGATATKKVLPEYDPPTGGSVVIHGKTGDTYTGSTTVTLELNANDPSGPPQMCVGNTPTCSNWVAYAPEKTWYLISGNGERTVYVRFRDKYGNTTGVHSDTIVLDMAKPLDGTVATASGDRQLSLTWEGFSDAHSGIVGYSAVFQIGSAPTSCTSGMPVPGYDGTSPGLVHQPLVNGTTYGYRICAIDAAGNLSPGRTAIDGPVPEKNPPTGNVIINNDDPITGKRVVILTFQDVKDDSGGAVKMCVSNTESCANWETALATKSWTLSSGSGEKTVYVWFRDQWGNTSEEPTWASILLDVTPPTNGTITASSLDGSVALELVGFNDLHSHIINYRVVYSMGGTPASCESGLRVPDDSVFVGDPGSVQLEGLLPAKTYGFRVCAIDAAGNRSSGATKTIIVE